MLDGSASTSSGQPSASATRQANAPLSPSSANGWSSGAPLSPASVTASVPAMSAQNIGSPLHVADLTPSNSAVIRPTTTTTIDGANVVLVPAAVEDAALCNHGGPMSDSATMPPVRSSSRLTKQTSSYSTTPSLTMSAWRGGEAEGDVGYSYSRRASQVFDPTEVPVLRHTMPITVTRDGKVVQEALDPYELARLYGQQQAALRSLQSRYDFLTVPDWVRLHPMLGTYLAELVGSFAWVLTLALVSVRNQSIFTVADDTNMTAIPIGFMFTSMIFTFGYISSSHFNPAVSVAVFLVRQMDLSQCFAYILCQLGGAFLAGIVSMVIQGNTDIFVPSISSSYITSGIFSELIFTFAICLVVLNIAYSRQHGNFFYGFAVGMTITAGSASVGRISGGAFNPAAATGLQVAMCIVSNCDDLKSVWIYWLAPLIGAVAAALLYSQMVQPNDTQVLEDNKVFQDVNLLAKQRLAAQAAAGTGAAAAATKSDSDETHSSTSSSSPDQPATPTSSSSSSEIVSYQTISEPSHTQTPRQRQALSREEVEEEEEAAERHTEVSVPVIAETPAATSLSQRPVLANNSDLDNWRRKPPPRREDHEAEAALTDGAATNWF